MEEKQPNSRIPLLPIAIGIVVLGAAVTYIAAPKTEAVTEDQRADFVAEFREVLGAFETFHKDTRNTPLNAPPGELPPGLSTYLPTVQWSQPTPIGGRWTSVLEDAKGTRLSAIAVTYGPTEPLPRLDTLKPLDSVLDDGDLATGVLRFDADHRRLVYLVESSTR